MHTNSSIKRSGQYWITAIMALSLIVTAGILTEFRHARLNAADTRHQGICMPMIEDFCPGQPASAIARKRRTFTLM